MLGRFQVAVKPEEPPFEEGLLLLRIHEQMGLQWGGDMRVGLCVWGPDRILVPV